MHANPPALPRPAIASDNGAGPVLGVDEAIAHGLELCWPVAGQERLQLENALGRVLFYAVRSRHALPLFDCSAVEGYALRLADLTGPGPWVIESAGEIKTGDAAPDEWPPGTVFEVGTGAPLPSGTDTVVMQEEVISQGNQITLSHLPPPGTHIRLAGTDLPQGVMLAGAGRLVDPRIAAVMAAAGQAQVTLRRRVQVALFGIGAGLRPPGKRLAPGELWDANRFHLTGALSQPWVDLLDLGTVADETRALRITLERAAYAADLVISTGGIANTTAGNLHAALEGMGADLHPMRLALRRGRYLLMGRIGKAIHIALPGNPVAAFIAWHVIGPRFLESLAGLVPGVAGAPRRIVVRAGFEMTRNPGLGEFLPARLTGHDDQGLPLVELIAPDHVHRLSLLAQAEGLVQILPETTVIAKGDLLEFLPF